MSKLVQFVMLLTGIVAGGSLLTLLCFTLFLMLTEFSPPEHVVPAITGNGKKLDPAAREFTFFTWNIGYAGLGSGQDFFYDGGKTVNPDPQMVARNFNGIKTLLRSNDTVGFFFLQEIDVHAKRTGYMDEAEGIAGLLQACSMVYATNYDCRFVPVPVFDPMGRVVSGLATFSQFKPEHADVGYYDALFPWPKRLVFLKRCYILLRFALDNGRELVIANTHNSAFDPSGALRKKEMNMLDSVLRSEYLRGNYVIAGGDWNSNPRGFKASSVVSGDLVADITPPIDPGFLPGWQFVYDPHQPSNRDVDMPYRKGVTKTTIIDFFVVSPNIEVKQVVAIPTGFEFSDHQPVLMGIRLKQ